MVTRIAVRITRQQAQRDSVSEILYFRSSVLSSTHARACFVVIACGHATLRLDRLAWAWSVEARKLYDLYTI